MERPVLTIFYQFDPWHSTIGGIQTVILSFLKYAPPDFEVRMVGTGFKQDKIGTWQSREYAGRTIKFMPLIVVENDNFRKIIPTTLKYTQALLNKNLSSDFMHFHRLEPTMVTGKWHGNKSFFLHNDIEQQMNPKSGKNAMLWKYFPKAYFALEGSLIKQFDSIYSCNTKSTKFYQQKYPEQAHKITYIKNTVDTEVFYPLKSDSQKITRQNFARKLGLAENTRFVLFVGRLHPQKDPELLVKAFSLLKQPDLHLLIAGDGELATSVNEEIQRCQLSQRVSMLGAVNQQEIANLQRIASVFALSSVYEGLPVSVLEALACGTPVVTTNCGETPQLLTANSGIVTRDRSLQAIADALSQVLNSPDTYSMAACVQTAEPFTARTVVNQVYEQMLTHWKFSKSKIAKS